jgi:protein lifeguard
LHEHSVHSGPNVDFTVARLAQVISGIGAVLFSLYLLRDLQLLMGGKKMELSPDEYVFASLNIYMDVMMIFIMILSLFGGASR